MSAVSAWEIATKARLGRLDVLVDLVDLASDFSGYLARERFEKLSISTEHGIPAGSLPGSHKDPFDRMSVAQAQLEGLALSATTLFSMDMEFAGSGRQTPLHSLPEFPSRC